MSQPATECAAWPVYLERCDPTRNMARFDGLSVTPTLFPGEWVLGV